MKVKKIGGRKVSPSGTKKYNLQVRVELMEEAMGLYGSQRQAFEHTFSVFQIARQEGMRQLRGYFNRQELLGILDALKGYAGMNVVPAELYTHDYLLMKLENDKREGLTLDVMWGFHYDDLARRIMALPHFTMLLLHDQVWRYWNVHDYAGTPVPDPEVFLREHV